MWIYNIKNSMLYIFFCSDIYKVFCLILKWNKCINYHNLENDISHNLELKRN